MGSTSKLEVTSWSKVAVMSQVTLCLMMAHPPLAQLRAWLTLFFATDADTQHSLWSPSIHISVPERHSVRFYARPFWQARHRLGKYSFLSKPL